MSKFIYFPSFSAGEYGDKLKKDFRFRNGMTCRFYSEEMEEKFTSINTNPSLIYIERCKIFIEDPPGKNWDGVWTMTSK